MGKVYRTVNHNSFYAPNHLKADFEAMGFSVLGEYITPPNSNSHFKVLSGPLCRLYKDGDALTPHLNETFWKKEGRKWREYRSAFLSYLVQFESFPPREMTARWEIPVELKENNSE